MDKTIIKILEKEIEEIETNNPEAFEAMQWDLNGNENTIFDCGFIHGLKHAMNTLVDEH